MNLYQVYEPVENYCYFVFSESRNRAKTLSINLSGENMYIDLRCKTLKKDVGGIEEVIESPEDKNYSRVTDLGFSYMSEEEYEEMMGDRD